MDKNGACSIPLIFLRSHFMAIREHALTCTREAEATVGVIFICPQELLPTVSVCLHICHDDIFNLCACSKHWKYGFQTSFLYPVRVRRKMQWYKLVILRNFTQFKPWFYYVIWLLSLRSIPYVGILLPSYRCLETCYMFETLENFKMRKEFRIKAGA